MNSGYYLAIGTALAQHRALDLRFISDGEFIQTTMNPTILNTPKVMLSHSVYITGKGELSINPNDPHANFCSISLLYYLCITIQIWMLLAPS